jgi:hypothetical protein
MLDAGEGTQPASMGTLRVRTYVPRLDERWISIVQPESRQVRGCQVPLRCRKSCFMNRTPEARDSLQKSHPAKEPAGVPVGRPVSSRPDTL